MRCLSLAQALRQRGADCLFLCRDLEGNLASRIREKDFPVVLMAQNTKAGGELDWEEDARQTLQAIDGQKPDWLIVDHYSLDVRWESQVGSACGRVMVIDDLANRPHACEVLLDSNFMPGARCRYERQVPLKTIRLLGPGYVLLHADYGRLHDRARIRARPIQSILLSFGYADQHNLTTRSLRAFLDLRRPDLKLEVTANPQSPHFAEISRVAAQSSRIRLHSSLPSLAPLMLEADLAVGAAGGTAWERCCLGLPALLVVTSTNQQALAKELSQKNLAILVGNHETATVDKIRDALEEVLESGNLEKISVACHQTVDGKGSGRVAEILRLRAGGAIRIRPVTREDEETLFRWVNDPVVRSNALLSDIISAKAHRAWFLHRLKNQAQCRIYMAETEGGLPIGQVRLELRPGGWEIDYSLDEVARGNGLGVRLLELGLNAFRPFARGQRVFGRVKAANTASCRIFGQLGFLQEKDQAGIFLYRKDSAGL